MTTSTIRTDAFATTIAIFLGSTIAFVALQNTIARSQKKNTSPKDIIGNSYAKGSEVVDIYRDNIIGKSFVITGVSSGLGSQALTLLAEAAAAAAASTTNNAITTFIVGVRNVEQAVEVEEKFDAAIHKNKERGNSKVKTSIRVQVFSLDLASLESVRKFAANVRKNSTTVDGILNNAGVFGTTGTTTDGYPMTWQINAMAPALLTDLLLPILSKDARIINVSSKSAMFLKGDNVPNQCPSAISVSSSPSSTSPASSSSSSNDYFLSKACQILHAYELTHRFTSSSSSSNKRAMAIEPGLVHTNILRRENNLTKFINFTLIGKCMNFMRSMDQGCSTMLFCLLAPLEDLQEKESLRKQKLPSTSCPPYYYVDCQSCLPGTKPCQDITQAHELYKLFCTVWGQNDNFQ